MPASPYRSDDDVFEEDIVFDQSGLLGSRLHSMKGKTASPVVRVRRGRCFLFVKTGALCAAFFVLGLCVAIPGPTLLEFKQQLHISVQHVSYIYGARSIGYLCGSLFGGILFDRYNQQFLVFISLLGVAAAVIAAPWAKVFWLLEVCMVIMGITMGFLDTGGNVLCLDLWGKNSGPFMQALHFSFGFGAFVAPLLAEPFLGHSTSIDLELLNENTSIPLASLSHQISNLKDEDPDWFNGKTSDRLRREAEVIINSTFLPVADEGNTTAIYNGTTVGPVTILNDNTMTTILNNATISKIKPMFSEGGKAVNESEKVEIGKPPPKDIVTTVSPAVAMDTNDNKTTTPKSRTPKPKPTFTDGRKLDNSQDWDKVHIGKPDPKDLVPPTSTTTLMPSTSVKTTTEETKIMNQTQSNITGELQSIFNSNSDDSNTTSVEEVNDTVTTVPSGLEVTLTTDTPTSTVTIENETSTASTATTSTPTVATSTTRETTELNSMRSTSTTKQYFTLPSMFAPMDENYNEKKHEAGNTEEGDTLDETPFTDSPLHSSDNKAIGFSAEPVDRTSSTDNPLRESSTTIDTPPRVKQKPGTYDNDTDEENSFLNKVAERAEAYGFNKFQTAYLIVGILVLLVALGFLALLCANPRDPRSKQEEGSGADKRVVNKHFKLIFIMLICVFYFLYVGMEVAFGQLLLTYGVHSDLRLTKSKGSYLTAMFWGSFAVTRFFSIFIASGLKPITMLTFDFICCAIGCIILSAFGDTSETGLWIGCALLGIGMASIFPTGIVWVERYIQVTNKVAAAFVIGASFGEMVCPIFVGYFVVNHPMVLMYSVTISIFLSIIIFTFAWMLATKQGEKYSLPSDAGYQLANQHDEDEDMIEMSPASGSLSSQLSIQNNNALFSGNYH